jgi:hypothetical protein
VIKELENFPFRNVIGFDEASRMLAKRWNVVVISGDSSIMVI